MPQQANPVSLNGFDLLFMYFTGTKVKNMSGTGARSIGKNMDNRSVILPGDPLPNCSAACPVHTDTRGYAEAISEGNYEKALDLLLQANPFPSVCGRICHHPCEKECRRKEVDAPVSLRMLKRFVVENTREYRRARRQRIEPTQGKKVAIIGSGPAGLTVAHDLALLGYHTIVFEQDSQLGGMLAHAIPRYRLPLHALREDIDDILAMGVETRTACRVGVDISLEEIRKKHDAVVLAIGLSESVTLPIPGSESEGVFPGITFLWDVANGHPPPLGDRVLIIGGGNVAVDAARTARRLGVGQVFMACLETPEEMPAWQWEIQEAREEGIEILNSWGPKAVLSRGGKVAGMELKRCTRVFDDHGRFAPQYDEARTMTLDVDQVIMTIGQRADLSCVKETELAVERGRLMCDSHTLSTSEPGVFACGEVLTGPGSAIHAIASGHRAAQAVHHYLQTGERLVLPREDVPSLGLLPQRVASLARKMTRREAALLDPRERIGDFSEIESPFNEREALQEARRCLACATGARLESSQACAGCLTCARVCPFGVATVDRTAAMPAEECQACGLCAAECPAAGIALKRFATNQMKQTLGEILAPARAVKIWRPFLVAYCCLYETTSRKYLKPQSLEEIEGSGILRIMVPCVGRLSSLDLVEPFEMGADRVVVIACKEEGCLYMGSEELLGRRVAHAQKFLKEIGLEKASLQFRQTRGSAEASWPAIWKEVQHETAPESEKESLK